MQSFLGGQIRCIMGDMEMANAKPLGYDTILYLTWKIVFAYKIQSCYVLISFSRGYRQIQE